MQKIFQSYLKAAQFGYMSEDKDDKIVVDDGFCFRREYVEVEIEMLWQIVWRVFEKRTVNKGNLVDNNKKSHNDKKSVNKGSVIK